MFKNVSSSFSSSLLPGCSIIHRQCESGLAQQGAYQLTMYSYRAVKMKRNVDPVNLCTRSKHRVSFQGNSTYICVHTVRYVRTPEHIIRTQCLHTFLPPTQLFLTDLSFFFVSLKQSLSPFLTVKQEIAPKTHRESAKRCHDLGESKRHPW